MPAKSTITTSICYLLNSTLSNYVNYRAEPDTHVPSLSEGQGPQPPRGSSLPDPGSRAGALLGLTLQPTPPLVSVPRADGGAQVQGGGCCVPVGSDWAVGAEPHEGERESTSPSLVASEERGSLRLSGGSGS